LAWQSSAIKMMPLRPSKSALRSFHYQKYIAAGRRPFTSSSVAGTVSPHRFSAQKRNQSTATATASNSRPIPSPAFNQEPHRNEVSPLQNRQLPELDDSYVNSEGVTSIDCLEQA
jgi:acetolactate synthase-1/2/3 large subunit